MNYITAEMLNNDDVIKWKHFPRYWPFVWGIHRWPVNSQHKGQWHGALMFSLVSINGWVNNGEAGDLRRHHTHPLWRHCNDINVFHNYTLCPNLFLHCTLMFMNAIRVEHVGRKLPPQMRYKAYLKSLVWVQWMYILWSYNSYFHSDTGDLY